MARIVVTTFGSTGDLNPFIALALALRSRGHDVHFAVEANFASQLRLLEFPVHLLTGDQRHTFGVPPRSNLLWTGNLSPLLSTLAVSSAFLPRPDD
jgi:UDP:flavonoid glycosyltransferase YjiC (YdhE family)